MNEEKKEYPITRSFHTLRTTPSEVSSITIEQAELKYKIQKLCVESGLNYIEVNKALYMADRELYEKVLTVNFIRL
ncbi:hypothetical protein QQG09_08860 [Melissococcus plutonius]|uniref:hypothetical protein n=1 Tax=Melissococcus plutonius TaxID=33970 RepID=UPI0021E5F3FA|nr:hypothetical protein [Melissococcus plutonius]MCV2505869.1 hypothetical protein [Melissococcus plutonius]MCV2520635.1 hypothetical protein [Melissococcus plutonius]